MYVITGATGHTGHIAAEKLLAAGKPVRAVARTAEKLQPLVRRGAKAVVADLEDRGAVAKAFESAQAVYAMIPTNFATKSPAEFQDRVGETLAGAIREMQVPRVVSLSSVGAQHASGVGPVTGLHRQEKRLDAIPNLDTLHVRAGFFMENFFGYLEMIRAGFIATPLEPDLAYPMVATRDVGEFAGNALLKLDFKGKTTREVLGQRDISMAEATRIIGKAIGKPDLKYIQATYEEAEKALVQAGIMPALAASYVEMYRAVNERHMRPLESRNDSNTTPTSFESFAQGLAAALG
jgi:uncharacterized protein YbjT (DUF2867 family)